MPCLHWLNVAQTTPFKLYHKQHGALSGADVRQTQGVDQPPNTVLINEPNAYDAKPAPFASFTGVCQRTTVWMSIRIETLCALKTQIWCGIKPWPYQTTGLVVLRPTSSTCFFSIRIHPRVTVCTGKSRQLCQIEIFFLLFTRWRH